MSRNRFISLASEVLPERIGLRPFHDCGRVPSPIQLGFTRVGQLKLSKSDISDFDRERVGVRGYGLSMGCNPSPGSLRDPTSPNGRGESKQLASRITV